MMFALLGRLNSWSNRLYGLDPKRLVREQEFRRLLRQLLLAAGVVAVLYLADRGSRGWPGAILSL